METYGEQGYYSREEDNDSITSRDRWVDRRVGGQTCVCVFCVFMCVCVCPCRHYLDEPPLHRDHYDGHAPYNNSSYGNSYNDGRRTTRRRLLPATPTGESVRR